MVEKLVKRNYWVRSPTVRLLGGVSGVYTLVSLFIISFFFWAFGCYWIWIFYS